jgi:AraC-like DNA-binding protein
MKPIPHSVNLELAGLFKHPLKSVRKIERCLPAKLHNGRPTFFMLIDIEDVFECQRLEIKFVAGVVIGRNRFRIRIDHDRFEPFLFQSKRGVHATVVEIGYELGFEDPSYFSRFIRRELKTSPAEFRSLIRQNTRNSCDSPRLGIWFLASIEEPYLVDIDGGSTSWLTQPMVDPHLSLAYEYRTD